MKIFIFVLFLTTFLANNVISSVVPKAPLILIGATEDKEFYITQPDDTDDFPRALHHVCPNIHGMRLASIENPEEFQVVDEWYLRTYGEHTSDFAWTAAMKMGAVPFHWATTGDLVNFNNAVISYPWNSGGWNGASWSWYNCLTIHRRCNRPVNSPPGCWPARLEYYYTDCRTMRRVICQKSVS